MHNPGINSQVYLFCLFVFSLFHSLILFKCSFITLRWTIQVIKAKNFRFYSQISGALCLKKAIPFLVLTLCLQANITAPEVGYYPYIKIYPDSAHPRSKAAYTCVAVTVIWASAFTMIDNPKDMGIPCNFNPNRNPSR